MRSNRSRPHLYDARLRRPMQRRHRLGHPHNDTTRIMRHVLRFRHLGSLRAGAERHPVSIGKFLSNASAERGDLAHRGYANDIAIHRAIFTFNDGNYIVKVDTDQRLEHNRTRRLLWLHIDHSLDSTFPNDKYNRAESEEGINIPGSDVPLTHTKSSNNYLKRIVK